MLADFIRPRVCKTNLRKILDTTSVGLSEATACGKIKKIYAGARPARGRVQSMEPLEQRIRKEGVVKPGGVLKVGRLFESSDGRRPVQRHEREWKHLFAGA